MLAVRDAGRTVVRLVPCARRIIAVGFDRAVVSVSIELQPRVANRSGQKVQGAVGRAGFDKGRRFRARNARQGLAGAGTALNLAHERFAGGVGDRLNESLPSRGRCCDHRRFIGRGGKNDLRRDWRRIARLNGRLVRAAVASRSYRPLRPGTERPSIRPARGWLNDRARPNRTGRHECLRVDRCGRSGLSRSVLRRTPRVGKMSWPMPPPFSWSRRGCLEARTSKTSCELHSGQYVRAPISPIHVCPFAHRQCRTMMRFLSRPSA